MKIKVTSQNKGSLKAALIEYGYRFPCGGKGACGRCKIKCSSIPATGLDSKFLSDSDINSGLRLACDKVLLNEINIEEIYMEKIGPVKKIDTPQIVAIIKDNSLQLALIDNEEIIAVENIDILEKTALELKSAVGKNSIELFERYSVAKATDILIIAKESDLKLLSGGKISTEHLRRGGFFDASLFELPSELVYIPPYTKDFDNITVISLLNQEVGELIILPEQHLLSFKSEDSHEVSNYYLDEVCINSPEEKALNATVKYFNPNSVTVIASKDVLETLKNLPEILPNLDIKMQDYSLLYIGVELLSKAKVKTRYNKHLNLILFTKTIVEEEKWQAFLVDN